MEIVGDDLGEFEKVLGLGVSGIRQLVKEKVLTIILLMVLYINTFLL